MAALKKTGNYFDGGGFDFARIRLRRNQTNPPGGPLFPYCHHSDSGS
jgi:hypothetical protein